MVLNLESVGAGKQGTKKGIIEKWGFKAKKNSTFHNGLNFHNFQVLNSFYCDLSNKVGLSGTTFFTMFFLI